MEALNLAIEAVATENPLVGLWMNWMILVSLIPILFVRKHVPARLALLSLVVIFPIGLVIFNMTQNVHLIGIAHLIVWGPLAVYLYLVCMRGEVKKKSFYGVWFVLFFTTIVVSLLFDVRDVLLVLTRNK